MPFEVKANMRLAPQYRRVPMSVEDMSTLDEGLEKQVTLAIP